MWAVLIGVAALLAFWAALIVAARRLPPGPIRDLVGFLPACLILVRRLSGDPRVPRTAKLALGLAALWIVSPIDPVPDWLPVIGPLDEVIIVALVLRFVEKRVPRSVLIEAWPGEAHTLDRLLGGARGPGTARWAGPA